MKRTIYKSREELYRAAMSIGGALHVVVLHDDDCTPARCVCEPEYVLEELTTENYLKGQAAQEEWKKKKGGAV